MIIGDCSVDCENGSLELLFTNNFELLSFQGKEYYRVNEYDYYNETEGSSNGQEYQVKNLIIFEPEKFKFSIQSEFSHNDCVSETIYTLLK